MRPISENVARQILAAPEQFPAWMIQDLAKSYLEAIEMLDEHWAAIREARVKP